MIFYKNIVVSLIILLTLVPVNAVRNASIDSLMNELEDVLDHRNEYLVQKQNRLKKLHKEIGAIKDKRELFYSLVGLYDEYASFNADSAYNITQRMLDIANGLKDQELLSHARLNRANLLCSIGMYPEALALIDSVGRHGVPLYLRSFYFHINRTLYGLLADYAAFEADKLRYNKLTAAYRDSIIASNPPGSLANVVTQADILNVNGKADKAIFLMKEYMRDNQLSDHEKAICAWTLSESYAQVGDTLNQKENLLKSSISDMKASVREYVSLRELALMLYSERDLDRAYQFMNICIDDATKCNARQRIIELNASYPNINAIYVNKTHEQKKNLERTIIIITILSLLLVALLIYTRKQMRRVAKARKEIEEAYTKLNTLTDELKASNKQLIEANITIAENSQLKEVYIGRYMEQCLTYIDKLDKYRKSLGKLISIGKTEEVKKLVKSSKFIDDELKAFYANFDATFLNLFPTFVEDLNKLLEPGEEIIPKRPGSLNTELRIYALLRLGISDSIKIARFLGCSVSTIYNYRTKVRNKAAGDRNLLEEEVLKIGQHS